MRPRRGPGLWVWPRRGPYLRRGLICFARNRGAPPSGRRVSIAHRWRRNAALLKELYRARPDLRPLRNRDAP